MSEERVEFGFFGAFFIRVSKDELRDILIQAVVLGTLGILALVSYGAYAVDSYFTSPFGIGFFERVRLLLLRI